MLIEFYILSVIVLEGKTLLWNENPYISAVINPYDDAQTKVYLNETSKIIMAL